MSDFQAILFDFGHTLVDFRRAEVALVNAYQGIRERLLEHAGEELPEAGELARQVTEAIDQMVQTSYREQRLQELDIVETMRLALAGIGIAISSELAHELAMLDHQAFSNSITIPEDNLSTLRELRRSGYKLGLVSNITLLPDLVKADLAALGITSSIDAVALSSDIGLRKPDPAIFGWVLDRLGVAPASAVFVGDRLRDDISGAQGVGIRAVLTRQFRDESAGQHRDEAVNFGGKGILRVKPDAVIDRLVDLPGVLEDLSRSPLSG